MSETAYITIVLYSIAFVVQLLTTILCAQLFKQSNTDYRWAWLFSSLGLGAMALERALPLLFAVETNNYNLTDAILSVTISLLLLVAIIGLERQLAKDRADLDLLFIVNAHDLLTNSLNKVEIYRRISEEFERANRNGRCVALLEMDIDHFKVVNDRYGHQAGDDVLIGLVRSTNAILRTGDSLGRIGGEEFLILLPETDLNEAKEVAERLRISVSNTPYSSVENQSIKITISIGITIFDPTIHSYTEKSLLMRQCIYEADMAMYQAKKAGRNRVAVWSAPKKE